MAKTIVPWTAALVGVAICGGAAFAADANCAGLCERDTLTDNWLGLGRTLAERGIVLSLANTQVYQTNLRGGLATHRRAGRYTGSYDFDIDLDLEKLVGLTGGRAYAQAQGGWSKGLNESSVGSLLGINGDAAGDGSADLAELWYEQALPGKKVIVRAGKIDLTCGFEHHNCPVGFDCSKYANSENTQFLADALVNNPTIPFPDNGLGAAVYVEPADRFYFGAAIADARADKRETGFNTAFHDEDYFLAIFETGLVTDWGKGLTGAYRLGFWYDPQPKDRFSGSTKRDDHGVYATFDQLVCKENVDPNDDQGLGLFARFGCADGDVSEINTFWSFGGQYKGLIRGRHADVVGIGVAQGVLSRDAVPDRTSQETVVETYYSAEVLKWLHVSGHVQYVANPGGSGSADDAVVVGVRVRMSF
jgi:porin